MEIEQIIVSESKKHNIPGMDWQDIAQEIRIKLWQKEKLFDPAKSSYKTWANKVMRNCIYDLLKASNTKKASYLNNAVSIEMLQENGIDIDERGHLYKLEE